LPTPQGEAKGLDTIGKRARLKIQAKKSSQMHECKLPKKNAFSPKFFFPRSMQTPHGNMNWELLSPLLVMHESSLEVQACSSQIYKEHYNMLKWRHRQAR
jgi:hypothetical protein